MCGAKEIYCCQSHCIQPVGWYIVEPCDAFTNTNSATIQAFDGAVWSLNWNSTTCGCSVPRVLRRQRCRYRTCSKCSWIAIDLTFTTMQLWAESAREYPTWWTQSKGDYLLFRRTKMRLKSNYELSQGKNGKQRAIGHQKNSATVNGRQYRTTSSLSNIAEAAESIQWPFLGGIIDGRLNIFNSVLYQTPEATRGDKWVGEMEDKCITAQGQEVPAVSDFNLEIPNAPSEIDKVLHFEYPPAALPQYIYGPPLSVSIDQEHCDKEEHTNQLPRLWAEDLSQISGVQHAGFDFNDPFWADLFASSGDLALNEGTNTNHG